MNSQELLVAEMLEEQAAAGQREVHLAEFAPFGPSQPTSGSSIDLLLDVVLRVNVELGNTALSIKEILALGPGSVVELDKMAGEPVDVFINGTQIARGEVVVVDEKFGVRVTDVVTPRKRIKSFASQEQTQSDD